MMTVSQPILLPACSTLGARENFTTIPQAYITTSHFLTSHHRESGAQDCRSSPYHRVWMYTCVGQGTALSCAGLRCCTRKACVLGVPRNGTIQCTVPAGNCWCGSSIFCESCCRCALYAGIAAEALDRRCQRKQLDRLHILEIRSPCTHNILRGMCACSDFSCWTTWVNSSKREPVSSCVIT